MLISLVNHTNGKIKDEEVQENVRAVNRQIMHDFQPYWHLSAELRLEGAIGKDPQSDKLPELRGDAIIYLWDKADVEDALGYHAANAAGVPFGIVFTDVAKQLGEPWSVTLSHEALELIADPEVNLLVAGPHPADPDQEVFHWYEMCDAVQDEVYTIDGIAVSNFLLPLYFTLSAEAGGRNDYLGRLTKGKPLQSFGINPGGYVGFYNPASGEHETFALKGDQRARQRLQIKKKVALTRRSLRYQLGTEFEKAMAKAMRRGPAARALVRRVREKALDRRAVEMIDHTALAAQPAAATAKRTTAKPTTARPRRKP